MVQAMPSMRMLPQSQWQVRVGDQECCVRQWDVPSRNCRCTHSGAEWCVSSVMWSLTAQVCIA